MPCELRNPPQSLGRLFQLTHVYDTEPKCDSEDYQFTGITFRMNCFRPSGAGGAALLIICCYRRTGKNFPGECFPLIGQFPVTWKIRSIENKLLVIEFPDSGSANAACI